MRYEPCSAIEGRPNIIVDGAPVPGTVLTLSHWPKSPTPEPLWADLSAQVALAWLRRPGPWRGADIVSNDHLDQDGLVSLYALTRPQAALEREGLLVDVARAGDFAAFEHRDGGRLSFAIATLADPERSPLAPATFAGTYAERTGALHRELLGRLPELMAHPERAKDLWAEEDASLASSETAFEQGLIDIDEVPALDLAVVRIPEARPQALATRFTRRADTACHPCAIHNRTTASRVLLVQGRRYQLVFRYESWVRYVSRPVPARVDLGPLAAVLQAEEGRGAQWVADSVSALVPSLAVAPGQESSLAPERVLALAGHHLATAPPAWSTGARG